MDAPGKPFSADLSPAESRKWMGRLLIAVVLGAALWNFVAALTSSVIVPGLARIMETDPQSPLYLGKGDINVPSIFAAVLELCLAVLAALMVNSWAQRRPGMAKRKSSSRSPAKTLSIAAPAAAPVRDPASQAPQPAQAPAVPTQPVSPPPVPAAQVAAPPPPPPAKPIQSEKPAPKKPKEVYYNLVGEPVDPDE